MSADALTERLSAAERDRSHPPIKVRDAASLIIIDRSGREPKVLMGRRSGRHAFMPNRFVFPGGRVDVADARVRAAEDYHPETLRKLTAMTRSSFGQPRARALGVAALRETFEETGVFVGRANGAAPPGGAIFAPFAERGIALDLSRLSFILRAITPPGRPRRYDTRFFVADKEEIAATDPDRIGEDAELEEIAWVTISKAKTMELPTITLTVLDEMMARLSDDPSLPPDVPVPYYRWQRKGFRRDLL